MSRMNPTRYAWYESPVDRLLLEADDEGLRRVSFSSGHKFVSHDDDAVHDPSALQHVATQLDEYFAGERTAFDLALAPVGTPFQMRCWEALQTIPYGQTVSYGEEARRIGKPEAVRAVGAANGANPISIIIPCHRVIGANGKLVGFGGGIDTKRALLEHEATRIGLFAGSG